VSPVAVSADRRFHRAHVKPSRRHSRLRHLAPPLVKIACLLACATIAAYKGGAIISALPFLQVDRIQVQGNQRLSSGAMLAALQGLRGENILLTDLDMWRDRLMASPWVREASFRRSLPSTIDVSIVERDPVAIGRLDGKLFLIDERGAVIDEYGAQYADFDLPIVDGLAGDKGGRASTDPGRGELAARVIRAVNAKPSLARRLSQVDVSNPHNAALILSGDPTLIYIGEDRFLPRLESYLGLAAALRERVADIDYVDLRVENRIYVRPLGNRSKKTR
jgi:cell division protein FtsQ